MSTIQHHATACRLPRHRRATHLVAADERSLAELQALVATLPLCATGRVFVEVPDETWLIDLHLPPRMVLTVLHRSRRSGEPGSGRCCAPGQALTRAVTAWADEMLCEPGNCPQVDLLAGFVGTADILDHLTERCGLAATAVRTPERFGLTVSR